MIREMLLKHKTVFDKNISFKKFEKQLHNFNFPY